MSNQSLIAHIAAGLADVRAHQCDAKAFANTLRGNGRALENMPYELIREMEGLAMDLEIASWYEDEDFDSFPQLEAVLAATETWIKKVPLD